MHRGLDVWHRSWVYKVQ
ncbi:unnamed protein product [Fusarium graminearum]|uniref:Uncharacterized protein n=1 Tax=Gibberella zeae TaxID=5518 RepID=A0A4V6J944_GIBZA|nr:unnamed protein product [Fusarium graminearum]CAG1980606.1 unnamed protein product [Fusarium graminearum]VTO90521.1 unnamed protein product [Fusarium graminearum]